MNFMKTLKITILALVAVLLLDACSIQSRRYRKGFHIESLAKHAKSANEPKTKDLSQLNKTQSDANVALDVNANASSSEVNEPTAVVAKAPVAKESKSRKVSGLKVFRTLKTFKKEIQQQVEKKNAIKSKLAEPKESEFNQMAVASFVVAMLSILSTLISGAVPIFGLLGLILALLSLIFSIVALSQLKKAEKKGKGLAIAALVLSIIYFVILLILILAAIALLSTL
jgi:hypothetical protein